MSAHEFMSEIYEQCGKAAGVDNIARSEVHQNKTDGHRICRHCGDAVPSMPISKIWLWKAGYCSENCADLAIEAQKLRMEQYQRRSK